jgi:hypothetical protein
MRIALCAAGLMILVACGCAARRTVDNDRLQAQSELTMSALSGASERIHASALDEAHLAIANRKISELRIAIVSLDLLRLSVVGEQMSPRNAEKVESILISMYAITRSVADLPPEALARERDPDDESDADLRQMFDEAADRLRDSFR